MTDINLLPSDKRVKDLREKELNLREKQKVNFDFNEPNSDIYKNTKKISILDKFKAWNKKRKEKRGKRKEEKEKRKKEKVLLQAQVKQEKINIQEKAHVRPEIKPVLELAVPPIKKPEIKTRDDLYNEVDLSNKKISKHEHNEKMKYTYGKKIENGFDVNLMPEPKQIFEISTKFKIIILLVVLIVSIGVLLALFFWFDSQVAKEMKNVISFDKKIEDLNSKIKETQDSQKDVAIFQKHMAVLSDLIKNHTYASKIFEYLEKNVVPGVYFETIETDVINGSLNITAIARDYTEVAKQILVFEEDNENILMASVSNLNLNEKKGDTTDKEEKPKKFIKFNLEIILSSNFFNN